MAHVYSASFLKSHHDGGGSFQCPPGYRAVLRFVSVFNSEESTTATGHVIHRESLCTVFQWVVAPPAAAIGAEIVLQEMRFVFDEYEHIDAVNDLSIDMTLSGYLLSLP